MQIMPTGTLIKANLRIRRELEITQKALEFYRDQKHFDTVRVIGDPPGVKRTRIIDTGLVAEEALEQISG